MSVNTMPEGSRAAADVSENRAGTLTLVNAVRSEWTKLWSLRSTAWTLLALVVLTVSISALISAAVVSTTQVKAPSDPTVTSLSGLDTGQLVSIVLGVLVISTEYTTASIRTTLTAVPRRLTLLGAKAAVLGVVALAAGTVASFAAFFGGQAILATQRLDVSLAEPRVLRAVVGGGLFLAGSAMFGFALGALLRGTASAITVAVAGLVVLPQLTRMFPGRVGAIVHKSFTTNAGQQIARVVHSGDALGPWTGYLVFTLWWVALLAVAAALMRRRDA